MSIGYGEHEARCNPEPAMVYDLKVGGVRKRTNNFVYEIFDHSYPERSDES